MHCGMRTNVEGMERSRMEELASRPNTTVFEVSHDATHEPWSSGRLREVVARLRARVATYGSATSDFAVRKSCLDDAEILAFQREHPKMYWLLTDRALLADDRCVKAVDALLDAHDDVQHGRVARGRDADAQVTRDVMRAFGVGS